MPLWYAYACNNIDDYDYYYKAAQWMPASEPAAEAAGSGIWYYRYACALMYCGRLEEARHYAETGVSLDPEYPWGWLETAKLRAHFGDASGALEAVDRGLALVPGDYEFTTLRRGRSRRAGLWRRWSSTGSTRSATRFCRPAETKNEAEKAAVHRRDLLRSGEPRCHQGRPLPHGVGGGRPYCTFQIPYQGGSLTGRFFLNEAALSKFPLSWVREFVRRLPELDRRGRTFPGRPGGAGNGGTIPGMVRGPSGPDDAPVFIRGQDQQMVLFDRISPLCSEDRQPALTLPEGGAFLAFVPTGSACLGPGPVPPGSAGSVRHPLPHRGGGI